MSVVEIEEFSSFEKILKFLNNINMPNFISRYFDEEPKYEAALYDVGGTVMTFKNYPLEIYVKGKTAELSVFIDFRLSVKHDIRCLKNIDKKSTIHDVITCLGQPDFEINEEKRKQLNHDAKVIKYFIDDEYSIAFDYNQNIELISIFKDKYR